VLSTPHFLFTLVPIFFNSWASLLYTNRKDKTHIESAFMKIFFLVSGNALFFALYIDFQLSIAPNILKHHFVKEVLFNIWGT
jgi:hypothetical protein